MLLRPPKGHAFADFGRVELALTATSSRLFRLEKVPGWTKSWFDCQQDAPFCGAPREKVNYRVKSKCITKGTPNGISPSTSMI